MVMLVIAVFSLAVLAIIAGAEGRARYASLKALTVVLLATRLATVAALEVMLVLFSADSCN